MIYLASKCVGKGWSFEQLKYGDDLYGRESFAYDVWEYVEEYEECGGIEFREKYKQYKLY